MISHINFDTILSDPMLLVASALLVLGPLVFLFALIKFLLTKKSPAFDLPVEDLPNDGALEEVASSTPVEPPAAQEPPPMNIAPYKHPEPAPEPPPVVRPTRSEASEKTVVMPSGMGEFQGQIEIAFSQIKTLNKKVYQIESEIESLSRASASKLETHELKEPPMNPGDFTQKLLKLAEHVIVLEKEVARLKAAGAGKGQAQPPNGPSSTPATSESTFPPSPKPPIMPI